MKLMARFPLSPFARVMLLAAVTGVAAFAGCGREVAHERDAAHALVDSVAAVAEVKRYAPIPVEEARSALVRADSLLFADDIEGAREGYSSATVLARLAVVEAERALAESLRGASASREVASDSL